MIAAIYARRSVEQNAVSDEAKSVARQVEHARQYAVRRGWAVDDTHVYIDDGVSGAEFIHRQGYVRLMNVLGRRAPFDVLIMSDLDRLGRETVQTPYAIQQLLDGGVRLFTYLDDREVTMGSATDTFLVQVQSFVASVEREKARQRTFDAMQRKARADRSRAAGHSDTAIRRSIRRMVGGRTSNDASTPPKPLSCSGYSKCAPLVMESAASRSN
jgi:DNA invertase Pin-like site-specific DNA recombinase